MTIKYSIKPFDELSTVDIYFILQARSQVFVVEQHCAYQDIDEVDFDSLHLVAHSNKSLVGYCRIIPPSIIKDSAVVDTANSYLRIGRVLVLPQNRHQGIAREIMTRAIKYCHNNYAKKSIHISAQTYLIDFYRSLGFEVISEPYMEDGLEHIDMMLKIGKRKKLAVPVIPKDITVKGVITNLLLFLIAIGIVGLLYLLI